MNIPARWTSLAYVTGAKMGGGGWGEKIQEKGNPLLFLPSLLINTCYAG